MRNRKVLKINVLLVRMSPRRKGHSLQTRCQNLWSNDYRTAPPKQNIPWGTIEWTDILTYKLNADENRSRPLLFFDNVPYSVIGRKGIIIMITALGIHKII